VLSWVNRITRIRTRERDLFGQLATRWRIIRTSNAYLFRDPLPCHEGRPTCRVSTKSENPPETIIPDFSLTYSLPTTVELEAAMVAQKALEGIRQQREAILLSLA
jgi:hypothetical protein